MSDSYKGWRVATDPRTRESAIKILWGMSSIVVPCFVGIIGSILVVAKRGGWALAPSVVFSIVLWHLLLRRLERADDDATGVAASERHGVHLPPRSIRRTARVGADMDP